MSWAFAAPGASGFLGKSQSIDLLLAALQSIGWQARWMALGLFIIAAMGIVIIHWQFGWFVGEHGTGGMAYSLSLMASLLVIAAADTSARQDAPTPAARGD